MRLRVEQPRSRDAERGGTRDSGGLVRRSRRLSLIHRTKAWKPVLERVSGASGTLYDQRNLRGIRHMTAEKNNPRSEVNLAGDSGSGAGGAAGLPAKIARYGEARRALVMQSFADPARPRQGGGQVGENCAELPSLFFLATIRYMHCELLQSICSAPCARSGVEPKC